MLFRFRFPVFFLLGVFLISNSPAQVSAQHKVYLGLKTGGSLSKTSRSEYAFPNPARFGLKPKPELGFVAHIPLNDSLSFQPELLFVKKGYQASRIYNQANGKANPNSYEEWDNTYFELPLLLKLAVGNKKAKFFFAAGPSFAYWASSDYYRDSTGNNRVREKYKVEQRFLRTKPKVIDSILVGDVKKPVTASYDSITVIANKEISAVFSTGFHYKIKKSMLIFDIRYVYGLTDIYKYLEDKRPLIYPKDLSPANRPARNKEFNRRFAFSISYLFSL